MFPLVVVLQQFSCFVIVANFALPEYKQCLTDVESGVNRDCGLGANTARERHVQMCRVQFHYGQAGRREESSSGVWVENLLDSDSRFHLEYLMKHKYVQVHMSEGRPHKCTSGCKNYNFKTSVALVQHYEQVHGGLPGESGANFVCCLLCVLCECFIV
jgi:hypothetical protein